MAKDDPVELPAMRLSSGTIRDPRLLTIYVATQLTYVAQRCIVDDEDGAKYECLHEIHTPHVTRVGFYRLVLIRANNRTSHIFDLQAYMDMRAEWVDAVRNKVTKMMKEISE